MSKFSRMNKISLNLWLDIYMNKCSHIFLCAMKNNNKIIYCFICKNVENCSFRVIKSTFEKTQNQYQL
jgi:hypothetical protein